MTLRIPVPETGVLKACLDLLAAERVWAMRMNSGSLWNGKRPVKFGVKGMGDILALPRVDGFFLPLWLECKSDAGRQSSEQKSFQAWVEREGHSYLLVGRPEQVLEWLRNHGVMK